MISNNGIRALFLALLCSGSLVSAKLPVLTPQNATFMFDIHDVVLKKDQQERSERKNKLTDAIKTAIWEDTKQFNPDGPFKLAPAMVWLKVAYKDVSAEGYFHLLQQYKKFDCAELARDVARAYQPITEMTLVLESLHSQEFPIRAGSNVGSTFYNDLVTDHPDVFKYFDPGTCVEFTNANGSFNWDMVKKPSHEFFKKHYDAFVKDKFEYCVFIDDKKENVDAANAFVTEDGHHPFIGIHFDRSVPIAKSVTKLRTQLRTYGITV